MKGILLSLILLGTSICSANSFEKLRTEYMKALHDAEEAPSVYELFLEVENPTAKILAYRGALEAIMTRTTYNVFKKVNYLKKSQESLNKAVEMAPNDLEIRFMRLAVQYEIPPFLGMSENIEEDKAFVVKHIPNFDAEKFPKQTCREIFSFMKRCNYFSEDQIERFRNYLALNDN
tara:strand:+ start:8850 stop:9377 length:528 start_codon:yes stop_codon:yes gene_type:complete